ncbi:MAG: hypothetical protein ACRD3O_21160, partial [Terriglobia bacterium]
RFTDGNNRVRLRWSKKPIREIPKDIGREKEYELPYAIACSIHRGIFEGMSTLFTPHDGEVAPDLPPSIGLVKEALLAAHTNLWFALGTLNDCSGLGFREKLEAAQKDYAHVWKG